MIPLACLGAAVLFLAYTLAGYPLLLDWMARRRPRPVRRSPQTPSVSIIVCVHNGEAFIDAKLRSILDLDYPRDRMEVLVVSDGSTDRTLEIAQSFGSAVRTLALLRSGKPSAVNAGIANTSGEIIVLTDVRQLLDSASLGFLMENFADPAVGVCSAELTIREGDSLAEANVGLYWRYELWIRLRLSRIDSIFGATGAYYAIRRELTVVLPTDALLDDVHLPLAAFFRGYRLILDPRARMFDRPTGIRSEFSRKVRTLAGNYQIIRAYPQLLGPANRLWVHFWSYKLARLLLPFALVAILVSSFWVPAPFNVVLLLTQAFFYGLSVADLLIPEFWFIKRLTSPVRTFVVLMAASLSAVSIFFIPPSRLWKH